MASAAYLMLLATYVIAGVDVTPFHGDEATQIAMGRDYFYQFVQQDLDRVRYQPEPSGIAAGEQFLRLINGTLPKYVFGCVAHQLGLTADQLNLPWRWDLSRAANEAAGRMPRPDVLKACRQASAIAQALSVWVVHGIGGALMGPAGAMLASGMYAMNPALLLNGRRAMMESFQQLFTLLVVLLALTSAGRGQVWLIATGAVAGLALASKHTALISTGAVILAAAGRQVMRALMGRRVAWADLIRSLAALGGSLATAAAVFYALTPAWWGAPIDRACEVAARRVALIQRQKAEVTPYADAAASIAGMYRQTFGWQPMIAEWPGFTDEFRDEAAVYAGSWRGGLCAPVARTGPPLLFLSAIGFACVLLDRRRRTTMRWVFIAWAGSAVPLAVLVPFEWQRYYLPALPVVCVSVSLAICAIGSRVGARIRPDPPAGPPAAA